MLVAYEIPNRDCGGASAGGAPDLASYDSWVANFAAGLGSGASIIVLEPDSIALTTCLSSQQQADRFASLSRAGATIHAAAPNAKVYLDGGHSAWNSASEQANRLRNAGILTNADGLFTNVSNFNTTTNEVNFAKNVLAALGNPSNLHAVVDTSRNGNGPAGGGAWCDPSGRAIGTYPTTNTGNAAIDAFLWVKPPGEADGCAGAAGTFLPDVAYQLASAAASDPASPTTTPPTTTPPTTTPPTSTPPTTTPPTTATARHHSAVGRGLLRQLQGRQRLERRLHRGRHRAQHRQQRRQRLVAQVDLPGRPEHHLCLNAKTTQSGATVTPPTWATTGPSRPAAPPASGSRGRAPAPPRPPPSPSTSLLHRVLTHHPLHTAAGRILPGRSTRTGWRGPDVHPSPSSGSVPALGRAASERFQWAVQGTVGAPLLAEQLALNPK